MKLRCLVLFTVFVCLGDVLQHNHSMLPENLNLSLHWNGGERLSSGLRIERASDDAAGLAIMEFLGPPQPAERWQKMLDEGRGEELLKEFEEMLRILDEMEEKEKDNEDIITA